MGPFRPQSARLVPPLHRPCPCPFDGASPMTLRLALAVAAIAGLALAAPLPSGPGVSPAAAATKSKVKAAVRDPETVIRTIYAQFSKEAGPAEAEQQNFSPDLLQLW